MANSALSEGAAAPDQKDWPLFFRGRVAANVRFWLARVAEPQATGELWYEEWHNVVKALGMALRNEHLLGHLFAPFLGRPAETGVPLSSRRPRRAHWIWLFKAPS